MALTVWFYEKDPRVQCISAWRLGDGRTSFQNYGGVPSPVSCSLLRECGSLLLQRVCLGVLAVLAVELCSSTQL